MIWTFKSKKFPADRDISVVIYDSDKSANAAWNSILQSKVEARAGGVVMAGAMPVSTDVSGSIQIINSDQSINGPDQLVIYSFKTPPDGLIFSAGDWDNEGKIQDESGNAVGEIKFSQLSAK